MEELEEILTITGVSHRFGGVTAIDNCSWSVHKGRIGALIGPNGSGKSTLVNIVAGTLPLQSGQVKFDGTNISGWPTYRIAKRGLIRTFQVARVFDRLTVLENMLVACTKQPGESLFNAVLRPGHGKSVERAQIERALDVLHTFDLFQMRNDYAEQLSGGQKRLLELARSLMSDPRLLVLDEPMAAINPVLITRISRHLQEIKSWGVAVLLVEHNLAVVEDICDSIAVMVEGKILASGSMAELRLDPAVVGAYFGR